LPHVPQFALSVSVSTHAPEQRLKPELHVVPQLLFTQVAEPLVTPGQILPQVPQLFTSLLVSTQASEQRMKGSVHWKPQLPLQVGVALGGAGHTVPHLPQLDVSLATSTHEPLQSVLAPQLVAHLPAMHTVPLAHTLLQSPQCWALVCRSTHAPEQF
jgi:hypothetical protein